MGAVSMQMYHLSGQCSPWPVQTRLEDYPDLKGFIVFYLALSASMEFLSHEAQCTLSIKY